MRYDATLKQNLESEMLNQFDQIAQAVPYQALTIDPAINPTIKISIKRLDCIHPQISGNKFFKLKYNLLEAQRLGYRQLLTFGGAYSNHIAATAYAAQYFGFDCIGIIRGEELANKPLNSTLRLAQENGMQLQFVSREIYRQKQEATFLAHLKMQFPDAYIIPEGGSNALAVQGCQAILSEQDLVNYDVICAAVGTGGTLAGIINASSDTQQILGFSALKGDFLNAEVQQYTAKQNWKIIDDYCCGGYAKTTAELRSFIDDFEQQYGIPLEPIYTGKMLYGLIDLLKKNYFQAGTRVLVIHSGGLQGKGETGI